MGVSCECGHFKECAADKTGLCWKNAETLTVDADTWDFIHNISEMPTPEQVCAHDHR